MTRAFRLCRSVTKDNQVSQTDFYLHLEEIRQKWVSQQSRILKGHAYAEMGIC